jgi:predicted ATPase
MYRANLDWGHDLLRDDERVVLRRLAIFAGSFTLEPAGAVAAGAGIGAPQVLACIANLVAKSLIAADVGGAVQFYRLLETTRPYALEKLAASGELESVRRSYAEHLRDLAGVGWHAPLTAGRSPRRRAGSSVFARGQRLDRRPAHHLLAARLVPLVDPGIDEGGARALAPVEQAQSRSVPGPSTSNP